MIVVIHHFLLTFFPKSALGTEQSWILAKHPGYAFGAGLQGWIPFNLLNAGQFAVWLFFLLSGYILVKPFLARAEFNWPSLAGDILKRAVRLGFPSLRSGLVAFACAKLEWFSKYGIRMGEESGSGWATCFFPTAAAGDSSLQLLLLSPFQYAQNLISQAWTIPIELVGSYISYGLAGIMHSSPLAWIIGFFAVLGVPIEYKCFALGTLMRMLKSICQTIGDTNGVDLPPPKSVILWDWQA